jgi:O-antigen/teichoic acid export membrane protein
VGAVVAVVLVAPADRVRPTLHWQRCLALLRESAPIAAGLVANALYIRALIIAMSLLSTEFETGLFGASSRVLEVFIGIPAMMAGAAFPILAHASAADEPRLVYAVQRLMEASPLVAVLLVLCLAFAAEPIIAVLGGAEFEDAAPVLQIQSLALLGAFLTQVWILALVAIRRQIALLVINAVGLLVVAVAAALLLPPYGAEGAAWAAVLGETTLAVVACVMLVRSRAALRPRLGAPLRILLAGGVAAGVGVLVGLPPVPDAVLAVAVFVAAAFALRAVPAELLAALQRKSSA